MALWTAHFPSSWWGWVFSVLEEEVLLLFTKASNCCLPVSGTINDQSKPSIGTKVLTRYYKGLDNYLVGQRPLSRTKVHQEIHQSVR